MARLKINKNPSEEEIREKFKKQVKDYQLWEVGDVQQDGTVLLLATEKKTGKWKNFYVKVIL